ncbi:MAG: hypothetical protein EOQ94_11175 [Mesorhizobium sp.]|uniref:hypothetical protein n=1 Tax=Mesorhizobium sp. TaxID=1871066 RepID=UPI000FE6907B|nr:hypothetical protein [Mesorhizobium sp.]RWI26119.1 MAG: hypothetical protein EOQ94_11175 [Mesorhizobium sp.]
MIHARRMQGRGHQVDPLRQDHMEECRACHMEVDWDLMNHPFIGFKASCGFIPFTPDHNEETYPCLTK